MQRAFLYIFLPSVQDYDVKMSSFVFYAGREQATTRISFSFWTWLWSLKIQLRKISLAIDNRDDRMTAAIAFSRENDAGSRARATF